MPTFRWGSRLTRIYFLEAPTSTDLLSSSLIWSWLYFAICFLWKLPFSRQACSPLIQLFFGFTSDIDQTNINRDIRDGNWLSTLLPRRDMYCIHNHNQGGSSGLDEPDLHLGCNRPLCQSLWTRVRHISLPPYRFLAIIHRRIATPPSHLSLWGTVSHIFCVSYTEMLFVKTVFWMFKWILLYLDS